MGHAGNAKLLQQGGRAARATSSSSPSQKGNSAAAEAACIDAFIFGEQPRTSAPAPGPAAHAQPHPLKQVNAPIGICSSASGPSCHSDTSSRLIKLQLFNLV